VGKLSKIPLVVQQKDILRDDSTLIYGNIHMFTRARFFLLKKKKLLTDNLTVLVKKGDICLFNENLREVGVYFKTRGDVSFNLIELRGGERNFLVLILYINMMIL
jgi:hypothetical protein